VKPISREREWLRGSLSKEASYRGDLGPKEIGKLIKLLKAQQAVRSDDDDGPDDKDLVDANQRSHDGQRLMAPSGHSKMEHGKSGDRGGPAGP
jgi:hypothetical protein